MAKKEINLYTKKGKLRKPHLAIRGILMALTTVLLVAGIALFAMAPSINAMASKLLPWSSSATSEEIAATNEESVALAEQVEAEGAVLLRNEGDVLPLSSDVTKVNVFGWRSVAWMGGGSGSGGVSSVDTDFLGALEDYGIEYNTELTDMYRAFNDGGGIARTLSSTPEQSSTLYEPSISDSDYYTEELLANAESYSDTAIVVLGRYAGESNDPTQVQYKVTTADGETQVDESRTTLDLSTEEEELLSYVGSHFENVIVVINSGNVMALGGLETIDGIDACLMAGQSGQYSASALPKILWGEVNPSGKTVDTWAYDFATAASYANVGENGVGAYEGADGLYPMDGETTNGNLDEAALYTQVSYADYAEGIYVGYRWYETADTEGYWDGVSNEYGAGYEGVVQYPFGYGLSYTDFSWEIVDGPSDGDALDADGDVTFTVRVTNTGDVAGKDVVELYFGAPYIEGQIEKSSVELGAYAKTKLLEPGESDEVTLTVHVRDMASYDCYDANENGFAGYELDEGEYVFSLRTDAHNVDDAEGAEVTLTLAENVQFPTDETTGEEVSNKFTGDDAIDGVSVDGTTSGEGITYLTRADFEGTFPTENVDSRPISDEVAALNLYTADWSDDKSLAVTTGADNGLLIEEDGELTELGRALGSDPDDERWGDLLDQLTEDEMATLCGYAYSGTSALESIGKPETKDADGPAQIGGFLGVSAGTGFPSPWTLAQTWNTELAREYGRAIAKEAGQLGYSGWYAPATNLHRSPFGGRNYEYYSEDPLISGEACGNVVAGSKEMGVVCYVKHFINDDTESYMYRDSIYIWETEQALRELYLEPFHTIIEDYGNMGLMTSYNRIGAVWAGGSEALIQGVLRGEWGYDGVIITDYCDHPVFMNIDQQLATGGDLWMNAMGGTPEGAGTTECTAQLRRAAKDVIYTYLNMRVSNEEYAAGDASLLKPTAKPSTLVSTVATAVLVVAGILFLLALRSLIKGIRIKKALKAQASQQA